MSTHCVLPWLHLATHPQGDVSLCCRVDYNDGVGMSFDYQKNGLRYFNNLNKDSLNKIINSDSFRQARLQMLKGEKPVACKGCYNEESLGLTSKRMRESNVFKLNLNELQALTKDNGEIDLNIEYAELRLGNLCNLKCRTCNPNSSSKWQSEYELLQKNLDFVRKYNLNENYRWAEKKEFWDDFLINCKNLRLLFINGGEPTLIEQHWLFLQKLVELGLSEKIDIKYNINMTYLPPKAFDIWRKFKSVFIGASVDDIEERNSYIRHGAKWSDIVDNIFKIKNAGFGIAIEQTVSVYNVYYLDEMETFCRENKIGYGLNFVYDPDYLSVYCIPGGVKEKVLEKLKGKISDNIFSEVASHLSVVESPDLWNRFKYYTEYLDKVRNESFKITFRQFSELLVVEGAL